MEKQKEYKTAGRAKILACLQKNCDRAISAQNIVDCVAKQGDCLNITTVYRYLDKLVKENLVMRYLSEKGGLTLYQYVPQGENCHRHLHIKCVKCGAVGHLDCDFMQEISRHMLEEHGFMLQCDHSVLYGVCKNCR